MFKQIFTVVLLLSSLLNAQDEYKPWIKGERERHSRSVQMSKIFYPGDTRIDITYYGLDLKVTYSPNYISGNVTIGVKSDTSSLNNCFLDLRSFLIVDSILLNNAAAQYTHFKQ